MNSQGDCGQKQQEMNEQLFFREGVLSLMLSFRDPE